jgi:hypothetical protein
MIDTKIKSSSRYQFPFLDQRVILGLHARRPYRPVDCGSFAGLCLVGFLAAAIRFASSASESLPGILPCGAVHLLDRYDATIFSCRTKTYSGCIPRASSTADLAIRFSTTNRSSAFLTLSPGITKPDVSNSGTFRSHAHFRLHTSAKLASNFLDRVPRYDARGARVSQFSLTRRRWVHP